MDIYEIRRANLQRLAATYPSKSDLAHAAAVDAPLMYKFINGTKNCGSRVARRIESTLELTDGYLDSVNHAHFVHDAAKIRADDQQQDGKTALIEFLHAASIKDRDAGVLLHIAQLMNDNSSLTP